MANSPNTRVSLILRLQKPSDADAWEQFCDLYQPFVYRIAIAKGLQNADANDLVQEVFTRVARTVNRWDTDKAKGSFRAWLGVVTRNLLIDFVRHQNRLPDTLQQTDMWRQLDKREGTPRRCEASEFIDGELQKQIFHWASEQVQRRVSAKQWQSFWQTAVEQTAVSQVAKNLNMSVGAVYVAKSRTMAELKKMVQTAILQGEGPVQ